MASFFPEKLNPLGLKALRIAVLCGNAGDFRIFKASIVEKDGFEPRRIQFVRVTKTEDCVGKTFHTSIRLSETPRLSQGFLDDCIVPIADMTIRTETMKANSVGDSARTFSGSTVGYIFDVQIQSTWHAIVILNKLYGELPTDGLEGVARSKLGRAVEYLKADMYTRVMKRMCSYFNFLPLDMRL